MAKTIQRHVRKRGFFGKLFKYLFIIFNILMVIWLISYMSSIGQKTSDALSDAEAAGTVIGGTIGTGMLIFIWVAGDIILGLFTAFTRGSTVVITEEQ